jgi:hypothetical protein
MPTLVKHRVTVNYLGKKLLLRIRHYITIKGFHLYEVGIGNTRYILTYSREEWYFIYDIEPSESLKEVLLARVIKLHENWLRKNDTSLRIL